MGFKKVVSGTFSWLWKTIKSVAKSGTDEIMEDVKNLALPIVEQVGRVDLNGDGRVAAVEEVIVLAKTTGLKWGKKLLANGEDEARAYLLAQYDWDLKRYISQAKVFTAVLAKFGLDKIPSTHAILGVIQAVLEYLDSDGN